MLRTLFVIITIAIIVLIFRSMWRSWQRRVVKGEVIPQLPVPPTGRDAAEGPLLSLDYVTYLGTVTDEHWLDRVAAQGLGGRGPTAVVVLPQGLVIERVGAATHFIPASAINEVALAKGIAGRVYGEDSVVVVSWTWGSTLMHTGLRVVDEDSRRALVNTLTQWGRGQSPESRGAQRPAGQDPAGQDSAGQRPAGQPDDEPPTPGGEK